MTYIDEPGLEGTSLLNPDLRVDFLVGAHGFLNFGFALNSSQVGPASYASFSVYDTNDVLLATDTESGIFTLPDGTNPSSFPEGRVEVSFAGLAAYALFDFSSDFGRYIMDNFEGNFGTTEVIPEPSTVFLLGIGLLGLVGLGRKKFKK